MFWLLRDNMEIDVVRDQLRSLEHLDPENVSSKRLRYWNSSHTDSEMSRRCVPQVAGDCAT